MATSRFRRLVRGSVFLAALVAAAWLMGCLSAAMVSPAQARYLALFSLTTPFAVVANAAFLFYFLLSRRKLRALLPAAALTAAYPVAAPVFGWHFVAKPDVAPGPDRLKVLTWNVHGLGIYDRPVDTSVPRRMLEYIRTEAPDIVCLVEFYTDYSNALTPHGQRFQREGGFREYRFIWDNTLGTKIYVGIALFSKYPVRAVKSVELAWNIQLLQADVEGPGGKAFRVFFVHLQSFMLADADKAYIAEVKRRRGDVGGKVARSKTFAGKFARAFYLRAFQAETVARLVQESPYPVIICGDLNDVPGSYAYTTVRGSLKDAFVGGGHGLGRTYNQILPTLRIDNIFYDGDVLKLTGFKTDAMPLSDHNPVVATFEVR